MLCSVALRIGAGTVTYADNRETDKKRQFRPRGLTPAAKGRFVLVNLSGKPLGFFGVMLPGSRSIRVASAFDPAALAKLVAVLEGQVC